MAHVLLISLYDHGALGLRHLSSYLKTAGHRTSFIYFKRYGTVLKSSLKELPPGLLHESIDLCGRDTVMSISAPITDRERDLFSSLVAELQSDLIGFSLRSISISAAALLSRDLRQRFPNTPILWGGIGPTLEPERCLQHCDAVCVGEGEEALGDLARALDEKTPWSGIANLWGNARAGQPAFRNAPRPLIHDLDALPWPDISPDGKFTIDENTLIRNDPAVSNFETLYETTSSRGCPFSCSFCCNEALHRLYAGQPRVRRRGPGNVIDEILAARRTHRFDRLIFQDDVFCMNTKWLKDFCARYQAQVGLPFYCYVYPVGFTDENLRMLREAGLHWTTLGIQSGSRHILEKVYKRRDHREAVLDAARRLDALGIQVTIDIITNNPLETDNDCRDTLQLLLALPPGIQFNGGLSKLSLFPATEIETILRDLPRPSAAHAPNHESYNILYLLSRQSLLPGRFLLAISRARWLMRRPTLLRPLLWPARSLDTLSAQRRAFLPRLKNTVKRVLPTPLWNTLRTLKVRVLKRPHL